MSNSEASFALQLRHVSRLAETVAAVPQSAAAAAAALQSVQNLNGMWIKVSPFRGISPQSASFFGKPVYIRKMALQCMQVISKI